MPEFALYIDEAAPDMLAIQEINERNGRHYYLLALNPVVRVTVRGDNIEGCTGRVLAVIAGVEECWGQWQSNSHLRGRKTYVVTVFSEDTREQDRGSFSAWLRRNYLADGAAFRGAGGRYTLEHAPAS